MSMLEFVSDLIGSLVWPVVVVILIVILQKEIRELLVSTTRLKSRDVEMDFERLKDSAKRLPPSTASPLTRGQSSYTSIEDQVLYMAEQTPSAAILTAWAWVETAMHSAVAGLKTLPDPPSYRSAGHNLEQLQRYAELPEEVIRTLHDLRTLRNKSAHDEKQRLQVSPDDALTYDKTAFQVADYLNTLARWQGQP